MEVPKEFKCIYFQQPFFPFRSLFSELYTSIDINTFKSLSTAIFIAKENLKLMTLSEHSRHISNSSMSTAGSKINDTFPLIGWNVIIYSFLRLSQLPSNFSSTFFFSLSLSFYPHCVCMTWYWLMFYMHITPNHLSSPSSSNCDQFTNECEKVSLNSEDVKSKKFKIIKINQAATNADGNKYQQTKTQLIEIDKLIINSSNENGIIDGKKPSRIGVWHQVRKCFHFFLFLFIYVSASVFRWAVAKFSSFSWSC